MTYQIAMFAVRILLLNEALALGENGCDGDGAGGSLVLLEPRAIVESVPGLITLQSAV